MSKMINALRMRIKDSRFSLHRNQPPFAFHGGLKLDTTKRALAKGIVELPVPPTLVLPLISYAKQPLSPLIVKGETVQRGQLLAEGIVAPTSGVVRSIEKHETIHPGALSIDSIVLDSDGLDSRLVEPNKLSSDERLEELIAAFSTDNVANAGDQKSVLATLHQFALAGLGGAGFPTAEKLMAAKQGLHTLIINAAECEPEIACDEALMQSASDCISKGIDAIVKLTQCESCVLAIEDSKPSAIACMELSLQNIDSSVQLMIIPTRYPAGAENPLIQSVTGRIIAPREKPVQHGIMCINVATAHAFWQALNYQPLDSRVISLGGRAMPNPCNVRARFGTPISFVLENTDNDSLANKSRVRAGGPLSGFDLRSTAVPVTARTNCILVEPSSPETPAQACIRCGYCADVCPAKLLPQQLHWYTIAAELKKCEQLNLDACIECGCCDVVCPASIKLTETFRYAKSQIGYVNTEQQKAIDAEQRFAARERRVEKRELAKAVAIEKRKLSIKANKQPDSTQFNAALERVRSRRGAKKP